MLLGLMLAFALCAPAARASEARTLAVLPLDRAAASAEYAGLGQALAGMMVSDLTPVPGLRLVERAQLDAVLGELRLRETGFLDPQTAARLGRGVGAQYVLVGSYSVGESKFFLDARIVEVETGSVVKGAHADGAVEGFAEVEGRVVAALAAGLDLGQGTGPGGVTVSHHAAPRFSAFAACGEGQYREAEGDADAAKAAYLRAMAADPTFAAAKQALDTLDGVVAAAAGDIEATERARVAGLRKQALASTFDERSRAADFVDDDETLAGWLLRLSALSTAEGACQQYSEMRHYLARHRWKVPVEPGLTTAVISHFSASELGNPTLSPRPTPLMFVAGREYVSLGWFPLYYSGVGRAPPGEPVGLIAALDACFDRDAAYAQYAELVDEATRFGVLGATNEGTPRADPYVVPYTVGVALELARLRAHARFDGDLRPSSRRASRACWQR